MKKIILNSLSVLLLTISISCENNKPGENIIPESPELKSVKEKIINSGNVFAFNFTRELFESETNVDNVFISPMSIYFALGMTYNGANGTTEDAFKEVLGWEGLDDEEINTAVKSLINELLISNLNITLEVANSIWTHVGFPVLPSFLEINREYYNATAQEQDFSDPITINIINDWIADKTHDKILNMLTELSPDVRMLLINAIYFKANWNSKFDEEANTTGDFYKDNSAPVLVTYMNQKEYFSYLMNDLFTAIQMPYNDPGYYMQIMVPNGNNSTNDIINNLDTATWSEWNSQFTEHELNVTIPKFKFEYGTKEIKQELRKLGLEIAFSDSADFSSMSEISLHIGSVKHKAFIEVNEKGSEAAAATIVEMELTSMPMEPTSFIADKPFIFTICEKETNSIIFIGKVSSPEYVE